MEQSLDDVMIVALPGAFHKASCYDEYYNGVMEGLGVDFISFDYYQENNPRASFDDYIIMVQQKIDEMAKDNPDRKIVLMGHSMGGVIVEAVAKNFSANEDTKNLIKGLVLLAPSPRKVYLPKITQKLLDVSLLLLKNKPLWFRQLNQNTFFSLELSKDQKQDYVEKYLCGGSMRAIQELFTRNKPDNDGVEIPVLVLGGKQDPSIPFFAHEQLVKSYPNSQLFPVNTGHDMMLDPNSDTSLELIITFLMKNFYKEENN